ncbi:integral membrane protein GPR180-like [Saccostrea echinata]|uniref:integral membrane protein GPR180-like n=1 Tax=Saccostrea echinata TaxID=191078 RepID=UPI002A7FA1AE|nr:integral membrane protein GPR180-like [Saccostrea echinata]
MRPRCIITSRKKMRILLCIFILYQISDNDSYKCQAKTVAGVFSSVAAQRGWGMYVTTFCFHGNALINYTLEAEEGTLEEFKPQLLLFTKQDLEDLEEEDCSEKLSRASFTFELRNTTGNLSVNAPTNPHLYHVMYGDQLTCLDTDSNEDSDSSMFKFRIQLLNPDSLGNPTEHFGDDETGLLRFYQLLTLAYFVLGCIFAPRLYETLSKGGPMQLVIILLTVSTCLQATGTFIMMIHLARYSKDGMGSAAIEFFAEFFDVLSQFAMLYMLLSLSLGWTLGTSYRFAHLQMVSRKPAAKVVGVLGIVQAVLFVWEQIQDSDHRMYHAHRSFAGIALVILRILLAALFAWNLNVTVSSERSALRREFYKSFTKSCMLWFLCYPLLVVLSWIFYEYLRYKLITMGVVLCQCCAVGMLYKLFFSRSLYWEISALSSTLPLRMDRTLGHKLYS